MRCMCFVGAIVLVALLPSEVSAHPIGFGVAEWTQQDSAATLTLRLPRGVLGDHELRPVFPESCVGLGLEALPDADAVSLKWTAECDPGAGGALGFEWLPRAMDVHLRAGGQAYRLDASGPSTMLQETNGSFLLMGFEHILLGWDHLLFVLGLLALVGASRRLVGVITSFTLGHSITLALATFDWVRMDAFSIEVLIAASIVLLGREILTDKERPTLTRRFPFAIAGLFGLLHGLGFAGALAEIGLPSSERVGALFAFNVGIELGQLLFVALVIGLAWAVRRAGRFASASWQTRVAAYAVGVGGSFALISRLLGV